MLLEKSLTVHFFKVNTIVQNPGTPKKTVATKLLGIKNTFKLVDCMFHFYQLRSRSCDDNPYFATKTHQQIVTDFA